YGEVPPDVAYKSDPDKVFGTETQADISELGKISPHQGSMAFWVKPEWQSGDQNDASFLQLGDSGLQIVKNVSYLRFEYFDTDGKERGLGYYIGDWKPGEPHYIVGNYSAEGHVYQLYVDGKMVSQDTYPLGPDFQ